MTCIFVSFYNSYINPVIGTLIYILKSIFKIVAVVVEKIVLNYIYDERVDSLKKKIRTCMALPSTSNNVDIFFFKFK